MNSVLSAFSCSLFDLIHSSMPANWPQQMVVTQLGCGPLHNTH